VNSREELEFGGQARTGREAIAASLEASRPGRARRGHARPRRLDVLHALSREGLGTRVVFVSGNLDSQVSYELIEAGAPGVLDKSAMPDQTLRPRRRGRRGHASRLDRIAP
jgi:two-component system nitrate/nitrite response regulator NarL